MAKGEVRSPPLPRQLTCPARNGDSREPGCLLVAFVVALALHSSPAETAQEEQFPFCFACL